MTIKLGNLPVSLVCFVKSFHPSRSHLMLNLYPFFPQFILCLWKGLFPHSSYYIICSFRVSSAVSCFSENSSQTVQDSLSSPLCRSSDSPPLQLIQPLVIYTPSKPVSSPEPVVDPPTPSVCCRCTRTHCLKLYCDCLRAGKVCTAECKCSECCNRPRCHERVKTLKKMKKTNPQAFKKCKVKGYESSVSCACQKSMCNKKYCSCYQSGKLCSSKCKCVDCNNRSNDAFV